MNHNCHGDIFRINNITHYRCAYYGSVTIGVAKGDVCPTCSRPIDATDHGNLEVITEVTRLVQLPGGRQAILSHESDRIKAAEGAESTLGGTGPMLAPSERPSSASADPAAGRRNRKSEWPQRLRHLLLMLVVVAISLYVGTNLERFISMAGEHLHPASSGAPLPPPPTEAEVEGLIDLSPAAIRQCVHEKVINEVAKSPASNQPQEPDPSNMTNLTAPQITVIRRLCQEQQSS